MRMKKLTVLLLTMVLLLCACTQTAVASDTGPRADEQGSSLQPFTDVAADAYYVEAVRWAVSEGVTVGTGANTFSPNKACTRAQIVTFLYRAAGSPSSSDGVPFTDVPTDAYYAASVQWAAGAGITAGTSADQFSPNAPCTRAQIVTFLYRSAGSPSAGDEAAVNPFTDVPSDAYYADAVLWAVSQGITKGTSAGKFSPGKECTRAEAVTFMYRSKDFNQEIPEDPSDPTAPDSGKHILVAYFSATGNTRPLAETVARLLDADLYEIVPEEPYTEEDLAYYTDCRADREQNDPDCRPAIRGQVENMAQYDTVVIGHPIWHGQAPRIISTFLESYDFSGKTLTTFCTSHSSPLGSSAQNLYGLVPDSVTWLSSRRFAIGTQEDELAAWLLEIGLLPQEHTEELTLKLTVNDTEIDVLWEDNESVAALRDLVKGAPLTIQMSPYGGFEQVGPIGQSIPRNDVQTVTEPGDIVLYSGDQIVVFYGSNSWAYTRLGKMQGLDRAALTELLGNGAVTLTLSFGT